MTTKRRIRLVGNSPALDYFGEDVDFAAVEVDCKKLYEITEPEINPLKKEAVERYISKRDELYMPVLAMYESGPDDRPNIRFIDGRHTFVTLYKDLRVRRMKVMVPQFQVGMFQRVVG
jgi:hypothetical protein